MKLKTLFAKAVHIGIDADLRGRPALEKLLKKEKERQEKLKGMEKELADPERTWNPYGDCRILSGTGSENIKVLMVGIDIETPEMLLADRLRERGQHIDALFIHHPEGRALADLCQVMPLQVDILERAGVPRKKAEAEVLPRMEQVWHSIHSKNLFREERAAELLNLPAFCCHTITDNLVWKFIEERFCSRTWKRLEEIIDALLAIPEYKENARKGNPPVIVHGKPNGKPGKVVATGFTGGTPKTEQQVIEQAAAGIDTILAMDVKPDVLAAAKQHDVQVVQCGHMASDTLGINLLLDKLCEEEEMKTVDVSGFIRVRRGS